MRLPFPTRISLPGTLLFATVMLLLQQLEHTGFLFSTLFFAFVLLSTAAFNTAGGFARASGSYVFWFALLVAIVGCVWKALLGEPADSNLQSPVLTMAAYTASMLMILLSVYVSGRVTVRTPGLSRLIRADEVNLGLASIGCLVVHQLIVWANQIFPTGNGSLISIINQENIFIPFAALLATVHAIRVSGGRRSVNVVSFIAMVPGFIFAGLLFYSKQGMFTPLVCWLAATCSQRFRLRLGHVVFLSAFTAVSIYFLVPLSQVGRALVPDNATLSDRALLTTDLLTHPAKLRAEYRDKTDPGEGATRIAYFNTPQGALDRMTMFPVDDALITYSAAGHYIGYGPVAYDFLNWIPHFILPNKEQLAPPGTGNLYAHEMGALVNNEDTTTGISFTPTAEAFHLDGWLAICLLMPFIWILLFITVDLVCGDLRESPFGLMAIVAFAHVAPESLISGLTLFIWNINLAIVAATIFCAYFAPVLGTLLVGSRQRPIVPNFASAHGAP